MHSHLVKHAIDNNHLLVLNREFTIISSRYRNKIRKRKFAEALMIKFIRDWLSKKEKSLELKRFNWTLSLHKNVYLMCILEPLHYVALVQTLC